MKKHSTRTTDGARGRAADPRGGVALIITLGLLAVLTLLAVAFAIAMRVESLAARNYANMVRARHLVQTSLAQAIDDINRTCAGATYPDWEDLPTGGIRDALASGWNDSTLTNVCSDLFTGEATNAIAGALKNDAEGVTAYWRDVFVTNSMGGTSVVQTNGRIAYLIVNSSGLFDINRIGGEDRDLSTDIAEIDISRMIPSDYDFFGQRTQHRRYETIPEVYGINTAVERNVATNFTIYSHDPDRDVYFVDTNELGSVTARLKRKFHINAITNYPGYNRGAAAWNVYRGDSVFMENYLTPLEKMLDDAQLERPNDVAWNIVAYLDPSPYPRGPNNFQYRHTEANKAGPLINEIVYRRKPGVAPTEYVYQFAVEVWYPFAPEVVTPEDGYWLQVGVFTNNFTGRAPNEGEIMNYRHLPFSTNVPIHSMSFAGSNEFMVVETPDIRFPAGSPTNAPASSSNPLWFLARVIKNPYGHGSAPEANVLYVTDEAMGYEQSNENNNNQRQRALRRFETPRGHSINDPRSNGQNRYWDPSLGSTALDAGVAYPLSDLPGATSPLMTLGTTNIICGAWNNFKCQGTPIWWTGDGPMQNISELGHIYRNNLDDERPLFYRYWRNIDLMNASEGGALLDWMTVRPTNEVRSASGLVSINSRQFETLYNLFHELIIGWTNEVAHETRLVQPHSISNLVNEIIYNGPYVSFVDMFTGSKPDASSPGSDGGPVAVAFRKCATGSLSRTNDILQEGAFRSIVELITFRQNMFSIVIAGQSLGRNGRTVVGEQRAIATVVRDSYTGRYFIRNFKWLTD